MKELPIEYSDCWYAFPSSVQAAGGCWIVRAGRNRAKPNYVVGPKMIGQYGLHFVLNGRVRVSSGSSSVELEGGDLFCLFPGKLYTYQTASGDGPALEMIWLALDGEQTPLILAGMGITRESDYAKTLLNTGARALLKQLLSQLFKQSAYCYHAQSLLYQLFWKLSARARGETDALPGSQGDWAHLAKKYMELHFAEDIHVSDLAHMVGIHRSHFSFAFTRQFGFSPSQYLQRLRMETGARLLRETALSVTEIALTTGYTELYAFTRSFKRYYGISPSGYRA
ncbi:AraC family transcriptional regulator [Paenibacillus alkaliterrae]|uniref:helix-turn-helix transcriptional regulator n=1 Tax=Paenibacillus alkaliterrae TaxID=320909 RepID=UPI001F216EAD|nr:AraC family transcriptional regulator [Paenibacillus alkaliterrae]MCF2938507.1 AraC family transcriptional regulator [Paenibacillus alkaliterrae]